VIKYGIHLKLQINKEFDAKIILNLINQTNKNGQDELVKRFITFYDFIDRFGLGMVILPSIVDNLSGTLTAKPCRVG
jgi:hypothetical protein